MRILFVTPRFPYPPLKGDSLRSYHQIRALSRRHEVSLLSMSTSPVGKDERARMVELCESVTVVPLSRAQVWLNLLAGLPSRAPFQVSYFRSAEFRQALHNLLAEGRFDLVHATLIRVLPYVWDLRHTPVAVDLIDSLTLNLQDRRVKVRWPLRLGYEVEYSRVRRYEGEVVRHFPGLVVSSPADRQVLGSDKVAVLPNGVDLEGFPFYAPDGRDPSTVVFTGNMGYHPNEEAVAWFAAEVWPLVRAARPKARFQVVGTNPGERVRDLSGTNGIEVVGKVPDVAAYLGRAAASVAPMNTGSGIQNKVLEAMSTGTPVVATSTANRGVGGTPGRDLLVADDPTDLAAAVLRLMDDASLRAQLGRAGRDFVERQFRWEGHAEGLERLYEQVLKSHGRVASAGHALALPVEG
ncbi:MAG TPA: TIGR03087 family PEP-CTERM/XrtA system glycosyltransferase [Chloroflexia bacterium]|jgi:sugar transferase (PEP-CTERM/EpsH1 system associated)